MDPMRLLIVDDEEELVSAVVDRLELRGIEAAGATSGDEAIGLLRERDFDVVILDVRMPGLGGIDVLRTIRRHRPDLRVILMTGHGSAKEIELGQRMGAAAYLQKPVDLEVLLETVQDVLGRAENPAGD